MTLGALDEPLKNIDASGDFLVGFNAGTGILEPEPGAGIKTALTLQLTVQSDLARCGRPHTSADERARAISHSTRGSAR